MKLADIKWTIDSDPWDSARIAGEFFIARAKRDTDYAAKGDYCVYRRHGRVYSHLDALTAQALILAVLNGGLRS